MQLPGYSARDRFQPWSDGGRDVEVGYRSGKHSGRRSGHPATPLRQTVDPGMRWTIGGENAIRALRSSSLSGRYGGSAGLETNACTPALVLPRSPAIGSHDGSARHTGRELRVSEPSLMDVPHTSGNALQPPSDSTRSVSLDTTAATKKRSIQASLRRWAARFTSAPFSSMVCASAITASLTGHAFRFRYFGPPGCRFG